MVFRLTRDLGEVNLVDKFGTSIVTSTIQGEEVTAEQLPTKRRKMTMAKDGSRVPSDTAVD